LEEKHHHHHHCLESWGHSASHTLNNFHGVIQFHLQCNWHSTSFWGESLSQQAQCRRRGTSPHMNRILNNPFHLPFLRITCKCKLCTHHNLLFDPVLCGNQIPGEKLMFSIFTCAVYQSSHLFMTGSP